jgi:hypothetical protein
MPKDSDILTVAREIPNHHPSDGRYFATVAPLLAQAVIDLSAAKEALEKRLEYQKGISHMLTCINEKLQEDRLKLKQEAAALAPPQP